MYFSTRSESMANLCIGEKIDALVIVESWKGGKWCRVKRRNRKIDICAYLVINGRKG